MHRRPFLRDKNITAFLFVLRSDSNVNLCYTKAARFDHISNKGAIPIAYDQYEIKTVANLITDRLREDIINGVYKAGEHIVLGELAQKYGVSHMPIREAFQCLKGEGLLEVKQYKGARVLSFSRKDVSNIYDIRMVMEQLIMSEVVQKNYSEEFLQELERINQLTDFTQPSSQLSEQYQQINNQFHYTMFTLCENNRARDMYVFYSNLFKALKKKHPNTIEEIRNATQDHRSMIEALRLHDAQELSQIIVRHATQAKNNLLKRLETDAF